ncbi:MAG: DUF5020 family protein [Bacteroidales bacterium]|nr:DUF5020 family protein [Bacteroidales bacterium]
MKKNLLLFAFIVASFSLSAKLNVQMHYDFGNVAYGDQLSNRPHLTATIENFTPDRCGSTYFFIDGNFGGNTMKSAYVEFAREFKFWKAPVAIHIEYNGGLSEMGGYDDAYLAGIAYNWASKDFKKTFSVQAMYRFVPRQEKGNKHSWQLTTVWGIEFAKGLCTFSGYTDLAFDKNVNGWLVFTSEPQFWFNLNALKKVNDNMNLSIGTELELSQNFVWPTDGVNNRFYAIPTFALKWTF